MSRTYPEFENSDVIQHICILVLTSLVIANTPINIYPMPQMVLHLENYNLVTLQSRLLSLDFNQTLQSYTFISPELSMNQQDREHISCFFKNNEIRNHNNVLDTLSNRLKDLISNAQLSHSIHIFKYTDYKTRPSLQNYPAIYVGTYTTLFQFTSHHVNIQE